MSGVGRTSIDLPAHELMDQYGLVKRCGNLAYPNLLRCHQHLADKLIADISITANVYFRLWALRRDDAQVRHQIILTGQTLGIPVDVSPRVNRDGDVSRLDPGR